MPSTDDAKKKRIVIDSRVSENGPYLVTLSGHLDEHTQDGVADAIESSFSQGYHNIILDMADLKYITSSGFSAIIRDWELAHHQWVYLFILNPPPNIQAVFRVLHLNDLVTITPSLADAFRHFDAMAGLPDALPFDQDPDPLPGEG